jgi:hypothetical protein
MYYVEIDAYGGRIYINPKCIDNIVQHELRRIAK